MMDPIPHQQALQEPRTAVGLQMAGVSRTCFVCCTEPCFPT